MTTKCKSNLASKKMDEEEKEGVITVECLRGRLLAERQVSRSTKEAAELITKKMEELEHHLKEEIRLREKAERRLKFLMKKLEFIKGSRSLVGSSEKLSSSQGSCLSSTSKEEEETQVSCLSSENASSMEEVSSNSSSKMKDISSGEATVVASTSSHEEEPHADNDFPWYSDTT